MSDEQRAKLLSEYMDRLREKYPSTPSEKIRAKAEELVAKKLGKPTEMQYPPVREAPTQAPAEASPAPPATSFKKKKLRWPWLVLVGFVVFVAVGQAVQQMEKSRQRAKAQRLGEIQGEIRRNASKRTPIRQRIEGFERRCRAGSAHSSLLSSRAATARALAARAQDALNAGNYERASDHITAAEIYFTSGEYPPGYGLGLQD